MQFIALDLETTGLNPNTDTIIEIAAIKFSLVYRENRFYIENTEEKTMLINPERPLEPEVSLITGISSHMLAEKQTWEEVREKVADFIGDLPIVGHNILFDKAVLEAHNIDISDNIFLDTFELSSILSIEAESLNLGFLADHYNIKKRGEEHRALTDAWLSVDLFALYLTKIHQWKSREKYIWNTTMNLTDDPCLCKIAEITGILMEGNEEFTLQKINIKKRGDGQRNDFHTNHIFHTYNILPPQKSEEKEFFESNRCSTVIVRNNADAKNLQERLTQYGISHIIIPQKSNYLSLPALTEALKSKQKYTRKKAILMTRLIFWREHKQSESLDGFRTYGEERRLLPQFRMHHSENCDEYKDIWNYSQNVDIAIMTAHTFARSNINQFHSLIFKDVTLLEGILRQAFSAEISFTQIFECIERVQNSPLQEEIRDCIEVIEDMYMQVANRPTGENPFPPGNFGETYVIDQKTLWKKMCKSLSLWTQKLKKAIEEWKQTYTPQSRQETLAKEYIIEVSDTFCYYHIFQQNSTFAILSIRNENAKIQYISNTLNDKFPHSISRYTDFTRSNALGNSFVEKNYGYSSLQEILPSKQIIQRAHYKKIEHKKTVILTTSLRHIREIHEELLPYYDGAFFVQGISGGKAKMIHNFKQESSAILIGLIESWRDMSELWMETEALFVAKVPFDPPSDPYFLIKTKSMPNNFNEYSIPMVIARVNTLVGNIRLTNPKVQIFCSDKRLSQSKWGKEVSESLL